MGEWKSQLSLRVLVASKADLETYAKRGNRTIGNLGETLIEWFSEQLRKAGSTEKLLEGPVPIPRRPDGNYRRAPQKP
jgi:hypothetical protein